MASGGSLLHLDVEIDFVIGAPAAGGKVDLFKIPGPLQTIPAAIEIRGIVKLPFGNEEFPADHLVPGLRVSGNLDLFKGDPSLLLDLKGEVDNQGLGIAGGFRGDIHIGIALVGKLLREGIDIFSDLRIPIGIASLDGKSS